VDQVGEALSAVTAATLAGGLKAATAAVEERLGGPLPTRLAIIAAGRFGGRELGYGSDADVLFVHEPIAEDGEGGEGSGSGTAGSAAAFGVFHGAGTSAPSGQDAGRDAAAEPRPSAVSLFIEGELGEPSSDPVLAALLDHSVSEVELTRNAADALHDASSPSHPAAAAFPLSVSPERERAATDAAHAVANELRRLLQVPTSDPPLLIDAGLRPEGRQGPLVRTLASYAEYYRRWSVVWESQALLRAEPVAGDPDVGARFLAIADPLRWPDARLDEASVREIRRIKARVEAERLPRGADKQLHTKLGPGGLADVEWTVQLVQLRHAHAVPGLRTTRTRQALQAAVEAGLFDPADAAILDEAWLEATKVRNGITLVRGRAGDSIPTDTRERAGIASYLGTGSGEFVEDYRRNARRARAVVERVFYG
jgi:glutamate-ammonia-ligase adenylyltransferase